MFDVLKLLNILFFADETFYITGKCYDKKLKRVEF